MKKKTVIWIVTIVIAIVCSALLLKPLGIISKDAKEFIFDDDVELKKFDNSNFYVEIDDEFNNHFKVNIDFYGDGDKYVGNAYLPGNTNPAECRLLWDAQDNVAVIKRLKSYSSGQLCLAGDGYDMVFVLRCNGKKYDFMLRSLKGSSSVKPLMINIDETKGTIENMNNSKNHSEICYGTVNFSGVDYYASVKGRGNATWGCEKKPYNISFLKEPYEGKKSVSMVEGVEAKKWSILANYGDPSLLRNKIGYDLAVKMGIGLPSDYYDVWMNGDYLGNYLVTPKNDYKASDNGFILELDNYIDDEDPQFYLENSIGRIDSMLFTIKDDSANLGVDAIANWMQDAYNAVENYESNDYLNYFDIDSWSKMYLFHEIVKNYDVVNGSILMHRDGTGLEDKLIAGPIWDLDNAMGTTKYNEYLGIDFNSYFSVDDSYIKSIALNDNNYCLLQELSKHDSFMNAVKKAYEEYKEDIDGMVGNVDSVLEIIGPSSMMNGEKWGTVGLEYNNYLLGEEWWFNNNTYQFEYLRTNDYYDYVLNLKSFIKARLNYLNDNVEEW